ncbi:MAG: 4Fe-4S binding protein [Spirochaetaceae bacterium]|nr:4Fe-4S binding protein [Spirochaetaceae bacterium]
MNVTKYKTKYLYLITLSYFILAFLNITFALLALVCMAVPFILLFKNREKTWCTNYCPRVDYFSLFRIFKTGFKIPKWFTDERLKKFVFQYFCINVFFIIMSTVMVSRGNFAPIDNIRFLIAFEIPGTLPQLWTPVELPAAIIHLSYRLYSIMFTSSVLGTLLAILFKPRTWCVVCPINTLSTGFLRSQKK